MSAQTPAIPQDKLLVCQTVTRRLRNLNSFSIPKTRPIPRPISFYTKKPQPLYF
ncbi:hypothetical protein HanPSC8_Chr09g0349721 [Helianthus annuus]|nr:hypothetical protein HanPSC8_Chr09g0349721 [Helianthus annuus]